MKSVPLHLPLRTRDAAALADLIYRSVEGKPMRDDVRKRINAQLSGLNLETLRPFAGSLTADPVHPSAYFIAVDATLDGVTRPLLLRIASAASPANALFPDLLLIGRMRAGLVGEVVVNALPFGPGDRAPVRTFIEHIDTAFMPRPQGTQPPFSIAATTPETILPCAFEAFRYLLRNRGVNYASIATPALTSDVIEQTAAAAAWSSIRAGWREGYTLEAVLEESPVPGALAPYTAFVAPTGMNEEIARMKVGRGSWKRFDPNTERRKRTASLTEQLDKAKGDFASVIIEFASV